VDQRDLEIRLAIAERELVSLQLLADHASDVVLRVGPGGVIRYASGAVGRVLGHEPHTLVHLPSTACSTTTTSRSSPVLSSVLHTWGRPSPRSATAIRRAPGVAGGGRPAPPDSGLGHEWVVLARDVTDRVLLHRELGELAVRDALTGLANRRLVLEVLARSVSRLARRPGEVAVAFVDLDGFKEVNDRLGHSAGDRVLVNVAMRLASVVRPSDTLGRLGGDEFCVVCTDLEGGFDASELIARLEGACRSEVPADGGVAIAVSASVGVATTSTHAVSPALLLAQADAAMYVRKRSRRLAPRR
jgi:diguanylate cyclase (GGDEF)-like protein